MMNIVRTKSSAKELQTSLFSWSTFRALVVAIHLVVTIAFSDWIEMEDTRIYRLVSFVLIGVLFLDFGFRKKINLRLPLPVILYVGVFVWSYLTLKIMVPLGDNQQMLISYGKAVIVTIAYTRLIESTKELKILLWGLVFSVIVMYYYNTDAIHESRLMLTRLFGTLGNANNIGKCAVAGVWAGITLWLTIKGPSRWIPLVVACAPAALIITLSGSRKAMLVLPIMLFAFALPQVSVVRRLTTIRRAKRWILGSVLALPILGYMVWGTPFGERITNIFSREYISASDVQRTNFVWASLRMFIESPIWGKGLDNFRYFSYEYGGRLGSYSHSTPFELLANTGLVGFVLYFGAIWLLYKKMRLSLKYENAPEDRKIIISGLVLIVVVVFYNIFSVMYADKVLWPLLGAYAGYLYTLSGYKRQRIVEMRRLHC